MAYRKSIKSLTGEYMRTNNDGKALFWVVANDPEPDSYKRIRLILSPFQSGEIVYLREAFCECETAVCPKDNPDCEFAEWRSPYAMSEALARIYLRIKDVRPERLEINKLSVQEIELDGGKTALAFLNDYEGFWVWRISFEQAERPGL